MDEKQIEKKNIDIINSLHRILRPFLLRRTKEDMAKSLPPKKEIQLYVGLTQTQVDIYKNILTNKTAGGRDKKFYMNVLMQLRKACNHPYLFEGIEPEDAPILGEHIVESSGKMRVLDKLLQKLYVNSKKNKSLGRAPGSHLQLDDKCLEHTRGLLPLQRLHLLQD